MVRRLFLADHGPRTPEKGVEGMLRFTSLLLVLLSGAQVRGQDAYPIRLKEAAPGDVRRSDVSSSTEITNKLVGPSGNILQEKTLANAQQSVYRETVLAKTAGQELPSRLRTSTRKPSSGSRTSRRCCRTRARPC